MRRCNQWHIVFIPENRQTYTYYTGLKWFRYLFISFLRVAGRFSAGCRFLLGVLFIDYPDGMMAQAIDALAGSAGEPFDAVARVARGDPGTVARGISGLRTQIANFKRIQDEIAFIDGGRSTLMLGEADRVSAGG